MPKFWNPESGSFVDIPDDAAASLGFSFGEPAAEPHMAPEQAVSALPEPEPVPEPLAPEPQVGFGVEPLAPPEVAPPPPLADGQAQPEPTLPPGSLVDSSSRVRFKGNLNTPPPAPNFNPYLESIGRANQGAASAIGEAEGVRAANEAQRAALVTEAAGVQTAGIDHRAELEGQRNESYQRTEQRIREAVDAVPAAEPFRVFTNMAGWQKGLLVLGGALNGWNVRFNQGKNAIVDALMQIAQQDMEAQKVNIETARERVFREERSAQREKEHWSDVIQDHDVGVLQRLKAFELQVNALDHNTESVVNKAKLAELRFGLQRASGELGMRMAQYMSDRDLSIWQKQVTEIEAMRREKAQQAGALERAKLEKGSNPLQGREIRSPITGKVVGYHTIGTPADVSDYNYKQAAAKSAVEKLEKFRALQKKVGSTVTNWSQLGASETKQRLVHAYNEYITSKVKARSGAAFTKEEIAAYRDSMPIERLWGPSNDATVEDEITQLVEEQNTLNSTSLQDGKGNPVNYDFGEVVTAIRARMGSEDKSDIHGPEGLHNSSLKFEASLGRKEPERVGAARDLVKAAFDFADTPDGRVKISELQAKWSKLPMAQRMLPDVQGDKDIVEVLETVKRLGEMRESGRAAGKREQEAYRASQEAPITHFGDDGLD